MGQTAPPTVDETSPAMDETIHTPPFATPPPPPPPLLIILPPPPPVVVLLQATDLPIYRYQPLLSTQDLPIKDHRFQPYRRTNRSKTPIHTHQPQRPTPAPQNTWSASLVIDRSLGPLSSPSPSPSPSPPPPPPPQCSPRHSSNSAGPSCLPQVPKPRISRPKGASRNKIADMVNWDPSLLKAVQNEARMLTWSDLDPNVSFKSQNPKALTTVREKMIAKFPTLDSYENGWPLDVILINILKYCTTKRGKDLKDGAVSSRSATW